MASEASVRKTFIVPVQGHFQLDLILTVESDGYVRFDLRKMFGEETRGSWPLGMGKPQFLDALGRAADGLEHTLTPVDRRVRTCYLCNRGACSELHMVDDFAEKWQFCIRRADLALAIQAIYLSRAA